MTNDTLVFLTYATLTVAVLSLLAQTLFLFGLFKSIKTLQQRLLVLAPRAESVLDVAEKTLTEGRKQLADVSAQVNGVIGNANEILEISKAQVVRVDDFLADASGRARHQMERVELLIDDTLNRVQDTVAAVQGNILKPVREINAVAAGFRTAFQTLTKGARPSVAQATAEEEMFI